MRCARRWAQTAQLIVNLVPELELVIGKQPPVPDLPPQDAQNRFQMVFRRFLGVFARQEHPLALFLDDLQWLDAATLDLLEHLVTHPDVRHLLLVGAYRDNEVGPSHPLMRTLEAIRNAGRRVREIVLAPLGLDDVGRLVADSLHCEPERARPLAQLVHEKTGGNPFFAIQFFTALAEEGLLAFDPVAAALAMEHRAHPRQELHRQCRGSVGREAEAVVRRDAGSPETTRLPGQRRRDRHAVPGSRENEEAIHAALWEAVQPGLVVRLDSSYKFLHDRIQEAAYSLIPEEQRADGAPAHWQAACGAYARGEARRGDLRDCQPARPRCRLDHLARRARAARRAQPFAGQRAKATTAYAVGARAISPPARRC